MMRRFALLGSLLLAAGLAHAQADLDAIVGKVEDMPILRSEVERQVELFRLQAPNDSTPADSLRKAALESMIESKVMLAEAKAESVQASDNEVEQRLTKSIENMRAQFPTEAAFQEQLKREGVSLAQLKEKHREDARSQIMIQKLVDRNLRPKVGEPTTKEMEQFYASHQDSFPPEPEKLDLSHILIVPKPGEQAQRNFQSRLQQTIQATKLKKNFATTAKKLSQDLNSAPNGGDLGWVSKGDLFPEIEKQVSKLKVGQVSGPIQSRVGIHFVKMIERKPDSTMHLAHILLFPAPTEADRAKARKTVTALRRRVAEGGEDFAKVAGTYSDDADSKEKGGSLGQMPVESFNRYPTIKDELAGMSEGDISDVVESDTGFHIFKLVKRYPMQQPTYETVKEQLKEYLKAKKMQELYENWMKELKKKYYVERNL
jgi:peptidyl-prolyl cis-trans isomerase SurA